MTRRLFAVMLMTIAVSTAAGQFVTPTPGADNVAAWRDHILPRAEEVRFEDIPWIDSFAAGLLAADRADKPLLFWGMNGHPLGCT